MGKRMTNINSLLFEDSYKEYLWGRKKQKITRRPGSLDPEEVKKIVTEIGINRKVSIKRIDVFGDPEDDVVEVVIVGIFDDHFNGKAVNPERKIIEAMDAQAVYIKGGGGTVEYRYDDGDIKEIIEDIDESIMEEIDLDSAREIISALEEGDEVRISYFDTEEKTAVNCIGSLLKKKTDENFIILATKVNMVELTKPYEIELDIRKNAILDIQII